MPHILINGIVSSRDKKPYVQMDLDGRLAQFSIAEARSIALDFLRAASYAEADAMIRHFFIKNGFPEAACNALMIDFRDYRMKLDEEKVQKDYSDPPDASPDKGKTNK